MKLVDILFVLTAAATANAILIPIDNNGSPQASSTSSQVSVPTDEPDPNTLDDLQSIVDAVNLSILDEDWKYLFDPIDPNTSNEDRQQPIDQPSSDTSSQVSGTTDKPDSSTFNQDQQQPIDVADPSTSRRAQKRPIDEHGLNISKQSQKQSMNQAGPSASKQSRKQSTDEPGLDIPDKDWQRLIDEVNSDTFEEWKELFDIAGLNTPSQVSDPIDQVDPNTFDKYQQQPADQPSSSISDQTQQHPIDATDLNISNKDPQQPIDQSSPSTSSQGRKRPIDETSQNTCSQAPGSTNEPSPSTSDEYWKPLFDIINPNIPSQDPIDEPSPSTSCKYWIPLFVIINPNIPSQDPINEPSPSTSKQSRKRRIDQPIPSTSRQDQQQPMEQDQHQPMEQGESGNTVPNQATVLNEQDQRTFNRIKKRLVASKKIAKEKREEYREYAIIGLEHKLVLAMGEEISGSTYDPNIEEKLRKEYIVEGKKVPSIRQELKIFMKRRGLEFQEPDSDSD